MTEPLEIALTNMDHLKKYLVYPYSTSRQILNVMDANHIGLDHFKFKVLSNDTIEETFKTVEAA